MQIRENNAFFKRHLNRSQSRAFDSSGESSAYKLIRRSLSHLSKILRSIDIESNDSSLSWTMDGRMGVFTPLSAENERSAVEELTGMAAAIA